MADRAAVQSRPSVAARLTAFVLERFPFAAAAAASALDGPGAGDSSDAAAIERLRGRLPQALRRALPELPPGLPETTPATPAAGRWASAADELIEACDGFLRRAALRCRSRRPSAARSCAAWR